MSTARKLAALALAVTATLTLGGCGTSDKGSVDNRPYSRAAWSQPLPDGRHVMCVYASGGSGGGVTCDWEGAK